MKIKSIHFLFVIFLGFFTTINAQNPNWSVNPANYQFSATYTTFLNVFGNNLNNTNDKVAAFVNGEIRGVGSLVYVASADKYVAYLTVYANINGENINFKIYNSTTDVVYNALQTDTFKVDANVGSVFQSFAVSNEYLSSRTFLLDLNFTGITPIYKRFSNKFGPNNTLVKTFDFLLPAGTNASSLITEIDVPYNANAFINRKKQISGVSVADFTNTVIYQILSEDEKVIEEYTVNVTVAVNNALTTTTISSNTPSNIIPKEVDVQFSNAVTGLDREDFTVTNAVVSKLIKIDDQNYKVEIVPVSEGDFSVSVDALAVVDADNQTNIPSNPLNFTNDETPPIITNLTYNKENNNEFFDITFSEEVINRDISDFELIGSNAEIYFKSALFIVRPNTFRLAIFRINNNPQEGNIFLKVNSNSDIVDVAGNKLLIQEMASYYLDNINPIIPVLPDIKAACSLTVSEIPKTTDLISGEIIGTTTDPLSYTSQGEYSINWTFTDQVGNSISVPQKIIIKDEIAPEIPVLPIITKECSITVTNIPTATDNCGDVITATTTDILTYNTAGEYTINWTFEDENGNIATAPQKVIVQDITAPEFLVLPEIKAANSVTLVAPTTTDNCAGILTATTFDPIFYNQIGQYVVNWFFDDGNGNGRSVIQNVIIFDPTPTVPVLNDLQGNCSVIVFEIPRANSVFGDIIATTNDPLNYTEQGEYTITWSFDFGDGIVLQSLQKVIVKDDFAPEVDFIADISNECSVTITEFPTAYDFCAGIITATTTDPLTYNIAGEYNITWTFDDGNGNTSNSTQKVTIIDSKAPNTIVLQDVTAQCSVNLIAPKTTDDCAGVIEGTTTDPVFYNQQGTYTVNWIFDDGNGNSISVPQNIIINNTSLPTAPTLADIVEECSVTITDIPETSGNGCSGKVVGTTTDSLMYTEQGSYTITWNFDLGNGTILQSTQKVIVKDTTAPIAPTLDDVIAECSLTISEFPSTSDNCEGTIQGTTIDNLTYTQQGEYIITWIFDDGNGNVSTANQKVIVEDTAAPIVPTLEDILGECSVTITEIPTTTDNCQGTITGTTTDNLTYTQQGEYTIVWSFDDSNGNVSTANQKVIVKDEINPIAIIKNIEVELDDSGNVSISAADVDNGSTDNCSIDFIEVSKTNFTTQDLGENTIVFTVVDKAGNKTEVNVKVTVVDKVLSIQSQNISSLISVFPNPVKNSIFIKNKSNIEIDKFEMYTLNGKRVFIENISKEKVDISKLSIGIYLLKIFSKKGVLVKKIIKHSN